MRKKLSLTVRNSFEQMFHFNVSQFLAITIFKPQRHSAFDFKYVKILGKSTLYFNILKETIM